MRIERIVRYTIDGKEFKTVKAASNHVEDEAAKILSACLRIHDGRHSQSIAAIESILSDPATRNRLAALLAADLTLDEEGE